MQPCQDAMKTLFDHAMAKGGRTDVAVVNSHSGGMFHDVWHT